MSGLALAEAFKAFTEAQAVVARTRPSLQGSFSPGWTGNGDTVTLEMPGHKITATRVKGASPGLTLTCDDKVPTTFEYRGDGLFAVDGGPVPATLDDIGTFTGRLITALLP